MIKAEIEGRGSCCSCLSRSLKFVGCYSARTTKSEVVALASIWGQAESSHNSGKFGGNNPGAREPNSNDVS